MKITKEYRRLEDIEEVSIHDIHEREMYVPVEQEFDTELAPFNKLLEAMPIDIDVFIPFDNGEDFIIQELGISALRRGNITQEMVTGRLLSKTSPGFFEILYKPLKEVYETHENKKMRLFYYKKGKLSRFSNIEIIYEKGRIFLISDHRDNEENMLNIHTSVGSSENKENIIEYFSQTGTYYKQEGKYYWSPGIYNIINRQRDENDDFYNIVLDLAIPEDKPLVEKILDTIDAGTAKYEAIIRIKTNDGMLKYLDSTFYTELNEKGELVSRYGIFKDITKGTNRNIESPIDFFLSGFKNNKKLAILIDPLNPRAAEFSQGFYEFIESDESEYKHTIDITKNIVEEDVIVDMNRLINNEIDTFDKAFTYNVNGDPNNQKTGELFIERFEFGENTHSMGFLTDMTDEISKQNELKNANEHQKVLIKEVHHRVKNNLQILNSFLNLEKRAYEDQPTLIIDHMQSRLTSLALLHEKTYNTTDFQNINLKSYIEDQDNKLRSLIGLRDGIEFESDIDEDLELSIEIITPLLLIVDEITMNSIKHAFPTSFTGKKIITKTFKKLDENTGVLLLKDNGVGLDNTGIESKDKIGCEIIKSLTRQLNGKIELIPTEVGTEYKLIFPLTMEHTITQ